MLLFRLALKIFGTMKLSWVVVVVVVVVAVWLSDFVRARFVAGAVGLWYLIVARRVSRLFCVRDTAKPLGCCRCEGPMPFQHPPWKICVQYGILFLGAVTESKKKKIVTPFPSIPQHLGGEELAPRLIA